VTGYQLLTLGTLLALAALRSPSVVDPKRTPVRAAAEAPKRAEAANPSASAPGLSGLLISVSGDVSVASAAAMRREIEGLAARRVGGQS
jgi:hypothetical protein